MRKKCDNSAILFFLFFLAITGQYLSYLQFPNYLKEFFLTKFMIFLIKIIYTTVAREKPSTELAAAEVIDRVIKKMDSNDIPISVYLYLSKAFDTLDHNILLHKLNHYGIRGTCLALLKSYLSERKQFVEFNGVKSSLANITTGVPQGSILGPLLFIIYTNDISNACEIFKSIVYADDTTLMSTLSAFNSHGGKHCK